MAIMNQKPSIHPSIRPSIHPCIAVALMEYHACRGMLCACIPVERKLITSPLPLYLSLSYR